MMYLGHCYQILYKFTVLKYNTCNNHTDKIFNCYIMSNFILTRVHSTYVMNAVCGKMGQLLSLITCCDLGHFATASVLLPDQ